MLLRTHTAKKMFDPFIYSLVRMHPSCRHIIHCRCMIDECIIAEWCCWCVCVCVCVWLCLAVPKAFHVLVAGHLEVSGWSAGRVEALIECLGTHHWTWGHGQRTLSISTKTMLPFPVNVKALFVLAHSLCVCVCMCVCAHKCSEWQDEGPFISESVPGLLHYLCLMSRQMAQQISCCVCYDKDNLKRLWVESSEFWLFQRENVFVSLQQHLSSVNSFFPLIQEQTEQSIWNTHKNEKTKNIQSSYFPFTYISGCVSTDWVFPSHLSEDTAFEAGVRVQIHSQAEPPFVHELGFGVAPGFQTFVATQEQRVGVPDFHWHTVNSFIVIVSSSLEFLSNPHVQLIAQR